MICITTLARWGIANMLFLDNLKLMGEEAYAGTNATCGYPCGEQTMPCHNATTCNSFEPVKTSNT